MTHQEMIEECIELGSDELSGRDHDFLIAVQEKLEDGKEISNNERKRLESLHARICR